jgi:hypothetical protein
MELEDYHGAYVELLNRAWIIFSDYPPIDPAARLENLREIENKALDLYDYILPTYPGARANLMNIAGLAEYMSGVIETGKIDIGEPSTIGEMLSELDQRAQAATSRFSRAGYYFKEALIGLTPGEFSNLEAALLLNDAIASLTAGDYDGYTSSIDRAQKSAIAAESAGLYAVIAGVKAIAGIEGYAENIALLQDAAGVFENLILTGQYAANDHLMNILYNRTIEYHLNHGDYFAAIRYYEALKKIAQISTFMPFSSAFYNSDLFKANFNLLIQYQQELLKLESKKRRLNASGAAGSISLKEVNDEILGKRGRFMEIRQDLKDIDPIAYSALVFDVPSIVGTLKLIPADEICIVPYKRSKGYVSWICGKDTMECAFADNMDELAGKLQLYIKEDCEVINIASIGSISDEIARMIHIKYPGIPIKRSYSLSDAYEEKIKDIRSADGVLIIRGEGYVLSDIFAHEIGARIVECNPGILDTDLSGYGWIIIDGRLQKDENNFLLSFWKETNSRPERNSPAALYMKDLPKLRNNAFGILALNSEGHLRAEERAIALRSANGAGASAVIMVDRISDNLVLETGLRDFLAGLGEKAPIESFNRAFADKADYAEKYAISYYGERGWRRTAEEAEFEKLFSQYLLAANQYFLNKKWAMARKFYNSALEISKRKGISVSGRSQALDRLLESYRQTERFDAVLLKQLPEYARIYEESGDIAKAASLYHDAARLEYGQGKYHSAIEYANILIEKSGKIDNDTLKSAGYSIRGRSRFQTGDLDAALRDLKTAVEILPGGELDERTFSLRLDLAGIFNMGESYDQSASILDSLENYITDKTANKEIYAQLLVEKSKYYIGTYRNAAAKKNLEKIAGWDNNNPEAELLMGRICLIREEPDSARAFTLKAEKMAGGRSNPLLTRDYHELLGDIYRHSGMLEEARIQYDLAKNAIKDFKYPQPGDLLEYKLILSQNGGRVGSDSLYKNLISSASDRVRNLCRYQLGYAALSNGDRPLADSMFNSILISGDQFSEFYLKWRAYFNLGLISDGMNKTRYFKLAEDSIMKLIGESDYITRHYGFHEDRADPYNVLADMKLSQNEPDSALDYMEKGFAQRISGSHFAFGEFDSTENAFLDMMFSGGNGEPEKGIDMSAINVIKSDEKYAVLWGGTPRTIGDLRQRLKDDESVLRFYERDDGFLVAYIDRDTVAINEYHIDREDLARSLEKMSDVLSNQLRADSVMEKWYLDLIYPFEQLLLEKNKLLIIPDGPMYFFPFEALKMPEGDYLSEIYSLNRHAFLPAEYPPEVSTPARPVLTAGRDSGSENRLVDYIAEPLAKRSIGNFAAVAFYSGEFSVFEESGALSSEILCEIKPFSVRRYKKLQLQTVMAGRAGNHGFGYSLWELPDEARSAYYWKFLTSLAGGRGFWKSNGSARSYLYGHYEGLPYFWGGNIYVNLN